MAGIEGGHVGRGDVRQLGKLPLQPALRGGAVAAVHPEHQAQRPHVPAAERFLARDAGVGHRQLGQPGNVERQQLVRRQAGVLKRVGRIAGLLQVARGERRAVHQEQAAQLEVAQVGNQGGGVHGDEHVEIVARRHHVHRPEVNLERRDAKGGARGGPNLSGEVGEGGEIRAGKRGFDGELGAGQLHAVAGVTGEADDGGFASFAIGARDRAGHGHMGRLLRSEVGHSGRGGRRGTSLVM